MFNFSLTFKYKGLDDLNKLLLCFQPRLLVLLLGFIVDVTVFPVHNNYFGKYNAIITDRNNGQNYKKKKNQVVVNLKCPTVCNNRH